MPLLTVEDYKTFPVVPADVTYSYGDDANQFGDLYLPQANNKHPVIVLVHGGGYSEVYDIKPMGSVAKALAAEGFAVWNIEYRRVGNDGDYPQMFLDVANATDYLRQIADTHDLDLDNVITVGHSAGGHLALWLAGRHKITETSAIYIKNPLPVKAVVALAPVADVSYAFEQGLRDALIVVMGGKPDVVSAHYQDASPYAMLPLGIAQTHIVGTEDTKILDNVKRYIQAAEQAGDTVDLITIPDVGHFEIVSTSADAWATIQATIAAIQ